MHRSRFFLGVLTALGVAVPPAHGEMYRCKGPDGKTIFTDQKGVCPDAARFEPEGFVHSAPAPSKHAPAAVRHHRNLLEGKNKIGAEEWKNKKREAEARIAHIQKKRALMKPYVAHCNRGGYVTTRDEAGLADNVSCSVLKRDFAALDAEEADARDYLENGLAEECRKAGCLPGWLR